MLKIEKLFKEKYNYNLYLVLILSEIFNIIIFFEIKYLYNFYIILKLVIIIKCNII